MMGSMTTRTASRPLNAARETARLDPQLRALRCEIARWALAAGQPLNIDAITVVLGARRDEAINDGQPFNRWTTNGVLTFLFGTADEWCDRNGVARSQHLGESLLTYLNFVHEMGALSRGSSPIGRLRTTTADLVGLTPKGHRRTTRNDQAVVPVPLRREVVGS